MSLVYLIAILNLVADRDGQFVEDGDLTVHVYTQTEFLFMAFFTYVNMKVFGHEKAFHKKWEPYFKARAA